MGKNTKKAKNNGKKSGKVGYKNPPKETRFSKTNQPENAGRPLGSPNRKNIIQELLDMNAPESLLAEVRKLNPSAKTLRDINTVSMFNRSLKGSPKAMEMMIYYDIGKPKEVIEHSGQIEVDLYQKLTKDELKKELDKLGLSNKLFDK